MRIVWCGVALALALGAGESAAQTLYKLIGKDGKVTYVDKPPKDFDGKVIPVQVDPKANTATLPKYVPRAEPGKASAPDTQEARVREARERLAAAEKALAEARDNPGPDDVQRVGNVGRKTARPVFSEAYQKRLDGLEKDVKDAQEALRRAESGR